MIIGFDIFYNFTESSLMTSSVDLVWAGLNSDITSIFPQLDFQNENTREKGMYRLFSLLLEFKGTVFQSKITFYLKNGVTMENYFQLLPLIMSHYYTLIHIYIT